MPVEKQYTFQTEHGPKTLRDLFDGRSQLVIYHFMFGPDYEAGCPACSSTADSFNGVLAHLKARDVTMICISRAPIEKLLAYRERMGWSFNWASSHESDFNPDYGVSAGKGMAHDPAVPLLEANELALLKRLNDQPAVRDNLPLAAIQNASTGGTNIDGYLSEGHGVSTFACEGDTVYHCYSSYARGAEFLMGYYAILDRASKGRDEVDQIMSRLRRTTNTRGSNPLPRFRFPAHEEASPHRIGLDQHTETKGVKMSETPAEYNAKIIAEFRANNGRVGGIWEGTPLLLLHHTGAKSGVSRLNPVAYLRDEDRYLLWAANGGAPKNPDWYHNLKAHPNTRIEAGRETIDVVAEEATGEEHDRLFARAAKRYPQLVEVARRADRVIPIIVLRSRGNA